MVYMLDFLVTAQAEEGGSQQPASRAVTIMGGSSVAANAQQIDRSYFRSQSLDLPRLEPGGVVARRLALLRRARVPSLSLHPSTHAAARHRGLRCCTEPQPVPLLPHAWLWGHRWS